MTGRVLIIGNVEEIPSKSGGEPFRKRVVVLNCTHSNYGDVYENYPSFEFSGKHVDDPAAFAVGEIVTISFALQGTKYQKSANGISIPFRVTRYKSIREVARRSSKHLHHRSRKEFSHRHRSRANMMICHSSYDFQSQQ